MVVAMILLLAAVALRGAHAAAVSGKPNIVFILADGARTCHRCTSAPRRRCIRAA
jgi:hypothetical protein